MTGNLYEPSIRRILEMLGAVPPHHVAVYKTNDSTCAQLGELSAVSLRARGAVGVVLEGGTRDVDFIVHEGFPVFCRYATPQDSVPRWDALPGATRSRSAASG
jgi:regulator of RNase E activity RraA